MKTPRLRVRELALLAGSVLLCFTLGEIGYRVVDPFPFFAADAINVSLHGNLTEYDETLGWRGIPNGEVELTTKNNRIRLQHNSQGFRDIEHPAGGDKPAIVFLGDSFTWGHEVELEEMFVTRVRESFPRHEVFNLSHRGYGTDQELLTFERWRYDGPLELVILMVCENDVAENNSREQYFKPKPKFELAGDELVLSGVPVPRIEAWADPSATMDSSVPPDPWWKKILFRSHLLHDVYVRLSNLLDEPAAAAAGSELAATASVAESGVALTVRILARLKAAVERRGGKLVIFFIPSKRQVEHLDDSPPYQQAIVEHTGRMGIESHDLAPLFERSWRRTYYRLGMHWNARGHDVAAEAIKGVLEAGLERREAAGQR